MTHVEIAVIPVAGLATRVQPLARSLPKEMLPLGELPILHRVAIELADAGVRHFVLVVGRHAEPIERYFHHIPELDERLAEKGIAHPLSPLPTDCAFTFVRQDRPLGVADAVRRAARLVGREPYFVHMGDSIIWKDTGLLGRMLLAHRTRQADATFAVGRRLPHSTSTKAVTEPLDQPAGRDDVFSIRRVTEAAELTEAAQVTETAGAPPGTARLPFSIGRFLLEGPMPYGGEDHDGPARFGGLTPLLTGRDKAKVLAVPLVGDETLLGVGTMGEYLTSWRTWLAESGP